MLDNKREYGVSGFGVSVTTMEEVFIKVSKGCTDLHDAGDDGKKQCKLEPELKNIKTFHRVCHYGTTGAYKIC